MHFCPASRTLTHITLWLISASQASLLSAEFINGAGTGGYAICGGKVHFKAFTHNLCQVCPSLSMRPRGVAAKCSFDKLYSTLGRWDQMSMSMQGAECTAETDRWRKSRKISAESRSFFLPLTHQVCLKEAFSSSVYEKVWGIKKGFTADKSIYFLTGWAAVSILRLK